MTGIEIEFLCKVASENDRNQLFWRLLIKRIQFDGETGKIGDGGRGFEVIRWYGGMVVK
jgi:hypothetical protein